MAIKNELRRQRDTDDPVVLSSMTSKEIIYGELILLYDYTQVAEEHRAAVIAHAKTIKRHERRTVESMVTIGHELIAVQAKLPHGQFLPWIEQEFGWQKTVAYNLIQLGNKFPTVGTLPPGIGLSALYQLTGPNLPDIATRHRPTARPLGAPASGRPSAPPPPPAASAARPLTLNEAIAVIWRALQHQAPHAPAERLAWLTVTQIQLFQDLLREPPGRGVILTAEIFTKAYATVTTDLAGTIEREARTKPRTTFAPVIPLTTHSHREIVVALRLLKMVKAPLTQAALPVNQYTPHGATIAIWLQLLDEIIADLQNQADHSSPQPEDT